VVHETGHHLDRDVPGLKQALVDYHRTVTQGATPRPFGGDYEADETFVPRTDGRTWINRYEGKTGGGEMTPMALQLLYQDPRNLQLRDPRLFDLILDHLREP